MLVGSVAMHDLRRPSKILPWVFDKSRAFFANFRQYLYYYGYGKEKRVKETD